MKGRVSAKDLVRTQARQGHFQARLPGSPRNKVSVDTVHGGLVQSSNGLVQPVDHFLPGQQQLLMLSSKTLRRATGQLGFAEFFFRKRDRQGAHGVAGSTCPGDLGGEGSQRRGVNAAAEKDPDRNVSNQMALDRILEQLAHESYGVLGRCGGARIQPHGLGISPVA